MGSLSEFSLATRLFLRAYPWRRIDPVPWTPLPRPLAACRVALVTSAGLVAPGQAPFDASRRGGDPSFREISAETPVRRLLDAHRSRSFDHAPMRDDPNLAFPLDRLHELAREGRIGSVNHRHLSFMGSLTAVGHFVRDTAPAAARLLVADAVDVALLVPV